MPPPKKREKDSSTTSTTNGTIVGTSATTAPPIDVTSEATKLNGHQDYELFLQAFEKPTQIYRYLRSRHSTYPTFLNRTLSYMKDRMSRNNKKRSGFKIDSMLNYIEQKSKTKANKYLNIIYNGLFDKSASSDQWWNKGDLVCVDSTLYKITKSKRKDSTSDFKEIWKHDSNVIYNPHEDKYHCAGISLPVHTMSPIYDQHSIYKLVFRIDIMSKYSDATLDENGEPEEIPNKFSKRSVKMYVSELIIFDKNMGMITEGDYEATFQEFSSTSIKSFSPKKRTWEVLPNGYAPLSEKFDVFNKFLTLKYRLVWGVDEIPSTIDRKGLRDFANYAGASLSNGLIAPGSGIDESLINHNNNFIKSSNCIGGVPTCKANNFEIVYYFMYSNNTRQQTEFTREAKCPWCTLDCLRLYALLKHLKLCHARFSFAYQLAEGDVGVRIDVTINDSYDGSYAGSPYDLAGPSGSSFARTCGPVRRTTVTNFLVCRPRRQKMSLDEFMVNDEDDLSSNQRHYITGHNRLYHHTETCLPVHPKELDNDSEGESDPMWLRQKTIQMIDEFSDVNEGEKELMKLWNLHVMKHGYVGDCQLPLACEMFLDKNGHTIIHKNLYRNFILHMCSLFDYGLVSPETVYKTVQKLQGMLSQYLDGLKMMSRHRELQLKYWLDVGIHKQDEQKLKSPQKQVPNSKLGGEAAAATALLEHKPMHPPSKRLTNAVKRASMHPQNIRSAGEKLSNSTGAAIKSGVAKKSALQEDEPIGLVTREKRTETFRRFPNNSLVSGNGGKERNDEKSRERNRSTDDMKSLTKRRLSGKDAPNPAKRNRSDNSTQILSARRSLVKHDIKHTTPTPPTNFAASSTLSTTLPTRLATRRSVSSVAVNQTAAEALKNSKATHVLRTRLSVPLTKTDKR